MVNTSNTNQEKLAQWLHNLVEILRAQGDATFELLANTVSGKNALIDIDGTKLQVGSDGGQKLQIYTEYPTQQYPVNFRTEAETLRDIISGKLTLDGAVATGKIYICGEIEDLLGIHNLVMRVLADSAINPQLQRLWEDFDQSWQSSSSDSEYLCLEEQKPSYGYLINTVPEDVMLSDVEGLTEN